MRSFVIVAAIVLATGCGGRTAPVPRDQLAASEAVKVLAAADNPYGIIYYPPVDLKKKPGS